MTRSLYYLANAKVRATVARVLSEAPDMTRVEIKGPKRTVDQNSRMWASLTDVAEQAEHCGRKYDPNTWKAIFLSALGRETVFVPSLDGSGLIPIGQSSSDLSKGEMSDLLELMYSWGAANGVTFHDQIEDAA